MNTTISDTTDQPTEDQALDPAEAMSLLNEQTQPDVPTIEEPSPGVVNFIYGVETDDGTRYMAATVRELNGGDEEAIAKLPRSAWNYDTLLNDLLIRRATETIGGLNAPDHPELLNKLIIGDRDLLFKEILLSSYGHTQTYENVQCPSCQFEHDIFVDFDDLLEVVGLPKDDKGNDVDPENIPVTLRDGKVIVFRYPTGRDIMSVWQGSVAMTMAEVNTQMMARCVKTVDGAQLGKVQDAVRWAQKLTVRDRSAITEVLGKQPQVKFKGGEVPCENCGVQLPIVIGWADLLQV